jgi:hypothetical protein
MRQYHEATLAEHPRSHVLYQRIDLEQVRFDLRTSIPDIGFRPNDIDAVLQYAWENHRWFFAAWQHPQRLSDMEGNLRYYAQLPEYRRRQCEIRRFRPSIISIDADRNIDVSIPGVLQNASLRASLQNQYPTVVPRLEQWLGGIVVRDLYDFGSHPELRLCTAIALRKRLGASGAWDALLETAYRERLFEFTSLCNRSCLE